MALHPMTENLSKVMSNVKSRFVKLDSLFVFEEIDIPEIDYHQSMLAEPELPLLHAISQKISDIHLFF